MNFLCFYQFTVLSSHAVDGHQVYSGGSVVNKASTTGIEISPTPPLIFTQGSKSAKFGVVFNITQIWAARVWKCSKISELWNKSAMLRWLPYVLAKFGEVGSTHLWGSSVSFDLQKFVKYCQLLFRTDFDDVTLDVPRTFIVNSTGQRSRSQRDTTYKNKKTL